MGLPLQKYLPTISAVRLYAVTDIKSAFSSPFDFFRLLQAIVKLHVIVPFDVCFNHTHIIIVWTFTFKMSVFLNTYAPQDFNCVTLFYTSQCIIVSTCHDCCSKLLDRNDSSTSTSVDTGPIYQLSAFSSLTKCFTKKPFFLPVLIMRFMPILVYGL